MRVVLGMTGASGAIYGYRLLEELCNRGVKVSAIASEMALRILEEETGYTRQRIASFCELFSNEDLAAPMGSGSNLFDAMVIAPCSMKTLGSIAGGVSSSLIARAADVTLKERRRLILVTRETPLSMIHIKNMLAVTEAGGVILPACPGFYHRPKGIDALVNHVVGKVLDQLGLENSLFERWHGSEIGE